VLAQVPHGANILHHCNTGALATVDIGTALGVIYSTLLPRPHICVAAVVANLLRVRRERLCARAMFQLATRMAKKFTSGWTRRGRGCRCVRFQYSRASSVRVTRT
jgi:methylthioribose-1-phosphate isomerase